MIIVCPECSTKFDIAPDRIPDGGTKVRCARCKAVFMAVKPVEQNEPLFPSTAESDALHAEPGIRQADSPAQTAAADEDAATGLESEATEFSYDKFQELDSLSKQDETFTFSAETDQGDDIFDASSAPDVFNFGDTEQEPESTIERAFNADDDEIIKAFSKEEEPPAEPEFPASPVAAKKGGPIAAIIRILLLLILGILIVAGVLVYINGPEQLNQTIQQLFGQQTNRPVQTGQISLVNLEGKFIHNEQAGELFLIRGEAINNFSEPRAAIQVKGVIFDQNDKPLLQKTVFCGNPFSDHELQTLSFTELEKIMGNQFGKELRNMKVDSKQAIPFDIVFQDLPGNLAEFSVKVTASKPATE